MPPQRRGRKPGGSSTTSEFPRASLHVPDEEETAHTPTKIHNIAAASTADLVVQLVHGDSIIHYNVCRSVLTHASSVFAKLVDKDSRLPSTKKRKRDAEDEESSAWFLDLHDDDPEILLLLFNAFHLHTDFIPTKVEFRELLSVAQTCDKYDCVRAMLPYSKPWLDCWFSKVLVKHVDLEEWLTICVIFGESRNFTALSRALAQDLRFTKDVGSVGTVCFRDGLAAPRVSALPDNLLKTIMEQNKTALIRMRSVITSFTYFLESNVQRRATPCELQLCQGTFYGNLVLDMRRKYSRVWKFLNMDASEIETSDDLPSPLEVCTALGNSMELAHTASEVIHSVSEGKKRYGYTSYNQACNMRKFAYDTISNVRSTRDGITGLDPEDYVRVYARLVSL